MRQRGGERLAKLILKQMNTKKAEPEASMSQCLNDRLGIRCPLEHYECVSKPPLARAGGNLSSQAGKGEETASCSADPHPGLGLGHRPFSIL